MRCLVIFFLLFTTPLLALELKEEDRIENIKPGYCAWACLETLGRHHKIENLYDAMKNRRKGHDILAQGTDGKWHVYPKNLGYDVFVRRFLKANKVNFLAQKQGNHSAEILEKYAETYGCMVVIKTPTEDHAIIVTKITKDEVEFYDPNYSWTIRVGSRKWFNANWYGTTYVVWP